ncbi:MAG TPA: hypothetical protein VHB47_26080 [Thermoanaerobaculia bacterium]|nr:hypothetical protein [Thermoanaerobaculia bacterium]
MTRPVQDLAQRRGIARVALERKDAARFGSWLEQIMKPAHQQAPVDRLGKRTVGAATNGCRQVIRAANRPQDQGGGSMTAIQPAQLINQAVSRTVSQLRPGDQDSG